MQQKSGEGRFPAPAVRVGLTALGLGLAACGGAARGPEVPAPEAPAVMAAFTGSWVLVPEESTGPARIVRDGRQRPGGGTGFLPPADGGRGGLGGFGGAGRGIPAGGSGPIGRRGGGGGRPIPPRGAASGAGEPFSQVNLMSAFDLIVTDSTLALTPRAAEPDSTAAPEPRVWPRPRPPVGYELRLDGKEADGPGPAGAEVTARWSGRSIAIERKVEDGPEVKEQWSVDDATGRLVVTREVELPNSAKIEQRQVYRRVEAPAGDR